MKNRGTLAILILLLVGCQTSDDFIGSGPITLSPQIEKYYEESYIGSGGPGFFIVSIDGRTAGYTFCSAGTGGCRRDTIFFGVIDRCERQSGQKCYIYAEENFVVWKKDEHARSASITNKESLRNSDAVRGVDGLMRRGLNLSDAQLCGRILSNDRGSFLKSPTLQGHVREAVFRELDPTRCARVLSQSLG